MKRVDELISMINSGIEEYILTLLESYFHHKEKSLEDPNNFKMRKTARKNENELKDLGIEPKLLLGKHSLKIKETLGI